MERRQQGPQPRLHISDQGMPAVLPHREDYMSRGLGWASLRHGLTICLFANTAKIACLMVGLGLIAALPFGLPLANASCLGGVGYDIRGFCSYHTDAGAGDGRHRVGGPLPCSVAADPSVGCSSRDSSPMW